MNVSFYLLTFLSGIYLFSTEFIASRKLFAAKLNIFFVKVQKTVPVYNKIVQQKLFMVKTWSKQSISNTLDLLEGGSTSVLGEIKNCGR